MGMVLNKVLIGGRRPPRKTAWLHQDTKNVHSLWYSLLEKALISWLYGQLELMSGSWLSHS